jgi:hypothetical protein
VHSFTIKTSRSSLCSHPWWRNPLTLAGAIIGVAVAVIVIYSFTGPLFTVFALSEATSWVLWLGFLVVMLPLTEALKALARGGYLAGGVP